MPKPRYIICSQSGSEDRDTHLVSLFNLIDKLQFTKIPTGVPIVEIRITAAWAKEPEDQERDFEAQISLSLPGHGVIELPPDPFTFTMEHHRTVGRVLGGLPLMESGEMVVMARVRIAGENTWIERSVQEYRIVIDVQLAEQQINPQSVPPASRN